jgi:hypothetical protein
LLERGDVAAARLLAHRGRGGQALEPLLLGWLGRRFPSGNRRRLLFIHINDSIAWPQVYPFFHYGKRFADRYAIRTAPFPGTGAQGLIAEADAIVVQAPVFPNGDEIERALAAIRAANPHAAISFFDWAAPTDVRFAHRVGDYVAFYAKKALLRDRGYYLHPQRGHHYLEEVFAERFDLIPDSPEWQYYPEIVERLTLAPGFVTAPRLLLQFEQAAPSLTNDRPIDVHARFAVSSAGLVRNGRVDAGRRTHWYVPMRTAARTAIAEIADRYRIAWEGKVSRSVFQAELGQSKICFSPFGFGELCWRDVEAILAGAVLLKPSMEHLECFCDIYVPGETYVPLRWDLSDLDAAVARLLANPEERRAIAEKAFVRVREYLAGPKLGQLLDKLTGSVSTD